MRSARANHNQIAVSAYARETAINTEQTLDLSLLAQVSDMIQPQFRRENNLDEMTGREEADTIYNNGKTVAGSLSFPKAQPQHFAFLYAFCLGQIATVAAGDGYEHTIIPISGDLDAYRSIPSFTAAQRYGLTAYKERFASMFVDSITARFARDAWVDISAQIMGTGKTTVSLVEEEVEASDDAVSLTLAANGVAGGAGAGNAAARLDAIHQIKVELDTGVWTEVAFTAVSDATPAVITIVAPGAETETVTYKIIYAPEEAAWMTFPARVSQTPLRVSEVTLMIGGTWDGTTLAGGRELACEVNSIEHQLSNNGAIEFCLGTDGAYASRYFRDGRTQTLRLDRELRDYIIRNYIDQGETFGVSILAEGAVFDDPHKYQVLLVFPKCAVLQAPISANGKRLAEAGDLQVMEDDTYGSVIVKVKDMVEEYAA
jgi:hypothetical protein